MSGFSRLSVRETVRRTTSGAGDAADACAEVLERITAYDAVQPQVWIARFSAAEVLDQARRVDERLAAGETLPLAGATFAVKDNIDVAGLPTTAACPAFAYRPQRSAAVVERLQAAGAVVVGKTNLDQFATGLVGVRSPYGAPGCVYNRDFVSGGSSSGSAVAVAAGLTPFALGTDTAGSGRVPAAFNHLVGLKPSKGRWSTRGLVPACRSLDCISVFTNDAADAALIDRTLAAFDGEDPYSRSRPNIAIAQPPRIGVALERQLDWLGDAQSSELYARAMARLEPLQASRVQVDISPLLKAARLLYDGPWVAERTAAMEGLLRTDPDAIHPVVRAIAEAGLGMTAVEAFRGQYRLQALVRAAQAIWDQIDVLVLPTTATAYRIAEVEASPVKLNSNLGLYTNFVNLLDMSGVAIPAGFRANGTGFGITLLGPASTDQALLELAMRYEAAGPAPQAPRLDLRPGRRANGIRLAVMGAHLQGMPLHAQLTSRGARLVGEARTAPIYKLYAMAETSPAKPALVHVGPEGAAIAVEVYELDAAAFGDFVNEVPPPLAIGTVVLEDGDQIKGFVAEPRALDGALDITALGGWRAYVARASEQT